MRAETGPIQFGDDWPGIFIRGDDAFGLVMHLVTLLANIPDQSSQDMNGFELSIAKLNIESFINQLQQSNLTLDQKRTIQLLKDFKYCIKE